MEGVGSNLHALVLPYPVQGHINPMLQFSKRLRAHGVRVTFLLPTSHSDSLRINSGSIKIKPISDGSKDDKESDGPGVDPGAAVDDSLGRFQTKVSESLTDFFQSEEYCRDPAGVIIYDSGLCWVLDVAMKFGVDGAAFFTQSCVVSAVYYLVREGVAQIDREKGGSVIGFPAAMSVLEFADLPSFVTHGYAYPGIARSFYDQFSNFRLARWLLFNSFFELEEEVVNWISSQCPSLLMVGPEIPSMYLDKRLEDNKDYGLSLFEPEIGTCLRWLDKKEANSVAYISFGSLAALDKYQMGEIAEGLKGIEKNFLWVVREAEKKKLPHGFLDEVAGKGLVLRWCPQLDVLAHEAVSCFVTHCGWNSTLKALSLGVPMVIMPQWTDQPTNARFIEDVWGAGIRVKKNKEGIITAGEVKARVNEVMMEGKGERIRENSKRWAELARKAMEEGGSSDRDIQKFVLDIKEHKITLY